MIGSLLSTVTKVATLPVDLAAGAAACVLGGDATDKDDRAAVPLLGDLAELRDDVCEIMEDID